MYTLYRPIVHDENAQPETLCQWMEACDHDRYSIANSEIIMTQASPSPAADCLICASETADDDAVVFRDELWACEVTPGYEAPGWLILRARDHVVGWDGLSEAALDTFARQAKRVVGAVATATGAAATYVMTFGESYPHFHVLIVPRGQDVPPEHRSANILQLRQQLLDREAALALVPAIQKAYETA